MTTNVWLIIIGALIAFLQGIILFVLLGFRSSINSIWRKLNTMNDRCLTHESRIGKLEGKLNGG